MAEASRSGPASYAQFDADEAFELLSRFVAIHPANLEDPVHGRYEKPRYGAAVEAIERAARELGLATRRYDPVADGGHTAEFLGIPRPNLIVDLEAPATERVLVLAHYDVVPVPEEQLGRWRSDPRQLTRRDDGRWYGRGANDDLGSGVVASLLALGRLARGPVPPRAVRLVVCCDEETGGAGGIAALRARDAARPPEERLVTGDAALIPDGSPHAVAGSSGVAFLDASFTEPPSLATALEYGRRLVALHEEVATARSRYPSPDYPDHGAPVPVLTGRATVTKFDLGPAEGAAGPVPRLRAAHAETDAANFIPEAVTFVVAGPPEGRERLRAYLGARLPTGFSLKAAEHTVVAIPLGTEGWQLVGAGGHGGSPHLARNPVPVLLDLLSGAVGEGLLDGRVTSEATFAVDLRLIPEATFAEGLEPSLAAIRAWAAARHPIARIDAPRARARPGYALPLDDPTLRRLAGILERTLGARGIFGEYGGTDASSLTGLSTSRGGPLPAIVYGSMDRPSRIHDAEESVDPRLLLGVAWTLIEFVVG